MAAIVLYVLTLNQQISSISRMLTDEANLLAASTRSSSCITHVVLLTILEFLIKT